jgi:hypothetical protein
MNMDKGKVNEMIDHIREINKQCIDRVDRGRPVQVLVSLLRPLVAKKLNFSLDEYFRSPEYCLEKQLEWKIYEHELFDDDRIVDAEIGIDYGAALEASLFGCKPRFRSGEEPMFGPPVIEDISDIENM